MSIKTDDSDETDTFWWAILVDFFSEHSFRLCSLNEFGHIKFIKSALFRFQIIVQSCSFCILYSALFSSGFFRFCVWLSSFQRLCGSPLYGFKESFRCKNFAFFGAFSLLTKHKVLEQKKSNIWYFENLTQIMGAETLL